MSQLLSKLKKTLSNTVNNGSSDPQAVGKTESNFQHQYKAPKTPSGPPAGLIKSTSDSSYATDNGPAASEQGMDKAEWSAGW